MKQNFYSNFINIGTCCSHRSLCRFVARYHLADTYSMGTMLKIAIQIRSFSRLTISAELTANIGS